MEPTTDVQAYFNLYEDTHGHVHMEVCLKVYDITMPSDIEQYDKITSFVTSSQWMAISCGNTNDDVTMDHGT